MGVHEVYRHQIEIEAEGIVNGLTQAQVLLPTGIVQMRPQVRLHLNSMVPAHPEDAVSFQPAQPLYLAFSPIVIASGLQLGDTLQLLGRYDETAATSLQNSHRLQQQLLSRLIGDQHRWVQKKLPQAGQVLAAVNKQLLAGKISFGYWQTQERGLLTPWLKEPAALKKLLISQTANWAPLEASISGAKVLLQLVAPVSAIEVSANGPLQFWHFDPGRLSSAVYRQTLFRQWQSALNQA